MPFLAPADLLIPRSKPAYSFLCTVFPFMCRRR